MRSRRRGRAPQAAVWPLLAAMLASLLLAACTNEAAEAEKRYQIVKRNGLSTRGEVCKAGREVADAYLRAGDEKEYSSWHLRSGIECQLSELEGPNGLAQDSESSN
jgi:hypothetical protein